MSGSKSLMGSDGRTGVFIPGVQKCGTSTLFDMLSRHSEITPSKFKEPQFFALCPDVVNSKLSWYNSLFGKADTSVLLDGSTFYFSSNQAWMNIWHHVDDPRIVIVVRDPVQRAYSAHAHMYKKVPSRDRRSFNEIVTAMEGRVCAGGNISSAEDEILRNAVRSGVVDASYINQNYLRRLFDIPFDSYFEDPLWPYRYFSESQYRKSIEPLYATFGQHRVKVIIFEQFITAPSYVVSEILDFLGLPVESETLVLPHKNRTKIPGGKIGRGMIWLRNCSTFTNWVWQKLQSGSVTASLTQLIRSKAWRSKPQLSENTYRRARNLLQEEYAYWSGRTDDVESLWTYNS